MWPRVGLQSSTTLRADFCVSYWIFSVLLITSPHVAPLISERMKRSPILQLLLPMRCAAISRGPTSLIHHGHLCVPVEKHLTRVIRISDLTANTPVSPSRDQRIPKKLHLLAINMSSWQNGGRAGNGNQVYYNPNRSNNAMMAYNPSNYPPADFQYKTKNMAIKYKGDANTRLAEIAGNIALLAAEDQHRNQRR